MTDQTQNPQTEVTQETSTPVESAPQPRRQPQQFLGQTTQGPIIGSENKLNSLRDTGEEEIPDDPVALETVHLSAEYTTPVMSLYDRKDLDGSRELLMFHSELSENADKRIRRNFTPAGLRTPRGQDWNEALVTAATTTSYMGGAFKKTVEEEGREWRQHLQTPSGSFGFSAPVLKENISAYSGEKAMLRVRSLLGMGGIISIPLFHSGFWVTLTAPPDGAVIELRRRLLQEKIDLGRRTFGLVFSNEQSYLNSWLLEFCLDYLYDTNAKVDNPQVELRELIKTQDLNILFWGMACLIWPRGFDYVRPLTTAAGVENYNSISAKINITKLLWVDNASFSDEAKSHLARRARSSVSVEEIKRYQDTFMPSVASGRLIKVNDSVSLKVASPSAAKYIEDGDIWISNIISTVDNTFTTAAPDEQSRAAAIDNHARAARLRNYSAWVKAIVVEGIESEDQELINGTLETLSQDDEYSKLVQEGISKFIDDSTRALVAIPSTNGKETEVPRFANLIPIDVINAFFTLLAQRVNIISLR